MVRLLARLRRSFERPTPTRRRTARPDVELLELRAQPATLIAPDLVAGSDTGLSSMDDVTSATTPRFAGITTSPTGATISLMVDGAPDGTYVIPLSGGSIFALEPTTPLADGAHVVQFLDSHTHHLSAALTIDVDTAAPAPSADFALDPAIGTTTATSLLFDGTGEPGATATFFFDGAIQATAPVVGDGTYGFVVDPVSLGAHEAYVTLTDAAGNVSPPSAPVHVTVALPTPPIAVDAGPDQTVNEGDTADLAATDTNAAPVSETWTLLSATNGQAIASASGPDLTFVAASAGVYVFEHTATDALGNVASADVTVTALDVPPTLGLTGPTTAIAGTEYDLSLSASDPGNEIVTGWHIVWGDGATSDLTGIATTASHVYAAVGTFTPTATASQGALATSANGPTITVQPPPPPSQAQSLAAALETPEDTTGVFAVSDAVADVGVVGVAGHTYGLAVDGVDDANGTWQYSLDDTNWSTLSVSPTQACLLSAGSFLRFIPAADYDGPSQLSARVWDQADASPAGSAVDLSAHVPFVSASDATIPLDVTPVNDPPTISLPPAQTMFRSQTLNFASVNPKIFVADVDDPVRQVALDVDAGTLSAPTNASVTATGNGTAHLQLAGPTAALDAVLAGLVYAAPPTPGTENLQVHVTDFAATGGSPLTTAATLVVTVANQAPTIAATPGFSVNANAVLTVPAPGLASAFQDSDGDALQIRLSNAPSVGTLVVHADGSFTYTPPTGYVGTVKFSVEAWDGDALSSPLLVAIDVKSIYGLRR